MSGWDPNNPSGGNQPGAQPGVPMQQYGQPGAPMQQYGQPGAPMQQYGQPGAPMPQPYGQPGMMPGYPGAPGYGAAPINIVVQNTNTVGGGMQRINNRSRTTAILLCFLFGGFGAHKFYLGKTVMGLLYFFFCWTFIPALIALAETVLLIMQSDQDFDRRYNY